MKKWLSLTFAFACGAVSTPGFAVEGQTLSADVVAAYRADMQQWQLSRAASTKVTGNNERPGTPQVSKLRAYPPSCAANALPDKPSGPVYSKDVTLLAANTDRYLTETVKVTVWRISCSSSGLPMRYSPNGTPNSMTLLRIDRTADLANQVVSLPLVSIAQGAIAFDTPASYPRLITEPNTLTAEILPGTFFANSATYVLENSPVPNAGYYFLNNAFKLRVNPRYNGAQVVDFDIPAYTPTADTYPDRPMPLDGYAAAQWTNAELGHGLLVQIAEQYGADGTMTRQLVYDLLLKDLDGNPFWLIGNAPFPLGATSITLDAGYLGANLGLQPWGKATFQLKHCNRLEVTYTPNADLAAPVPSFDGMIVYDRLFSANGMLCE
jgi:hypothetical protein